MAKALFITQTDLKRYSIVNGNVDPDKFIHYIEEAQDIDVQRVLGTKLFERIEDSVLNSTVDADEQILLDDYIKPMLIRYAMYHYIVFAAYQISNGGVYKHFSENSETATKEEVDFLRQRYLDKAEFYAKRFERFIIYNQSKFPEYYQNTDDDIFPSKKNRFSGWVL